MPAWRHGFLDRAAPGVDQVLGRKYLRRGDDIVLARGEQEYRATQIEEIDSAAERHETPLGEASTNSWKIATGVSRASSESLEQPAVRSIGAPASTSLAILPGKRAA